MVLLYHYFQYIIRFWIYQTKWAEKSPDGFAYFLTLHSVYHHLTIAPKSSSPNRAITLTRVYVLISSIYKFRVIKLIRNIAKEKKEEGLISLLFKYQNI